jgi:hypothetical protein
LLQFLTPSVPASCHASAFSSSCHQSSHSSNPRCLVCCRSSGSAPSCWLCTTPSVRPSSRCAAACQASAMISTQQPQHAWEPQPYLGPSPTMTHMSGQTCGSSPLRCA